MDRGALLVASTDKGRELLRALIQPGMLDGAVDTAASGSEARRMAGSTDYSLVIINTPLSDESGLELSMELSQSTLSGVLLLLKAELADSVAARVEPCGVMVVSKPVARPLFNQALRFSLTARSRMEAMKRENDNLQVKLQELRLVDRAKCVLIQYLNMTEQQAHRHIEKQAMDTRQTKVQIAKTILSTYEM